MEKRTTTTSEFVGNRCQHAVGRAIGMRYTRMAASLGLMAALASSAFVPMAHAQGGDPSATPSASPSASASVTPSASASASASPTASPSATITPPAAAGVPINAVVNVSPEAPRVGDQVEIVVTLINEGDTAASGVGATVSMGGTLQILDVEPERDARVKIETLDINVVFDTLEAGERASFRIITRADLADIERFTVYSYEATDQEPDTIREYVVEVRPAASPSPSATPAPQLQGSLDVRPNPAQVGDVVELGFALTNPRNEAMKNVQASIDLPSFLRVQDVSTSRGGTVTSDENFEVVVNIGDIGPKEGLAIFVTAQAVAESFAAGDERNNINAVASEGLEGPDAPDVAEQVAVVVRAATSPSPSASATPKPSASAPPVQLPDTGADDWAGWLAGIAAGGLIAGGFAARRSLRRQLK